jgi:quercetin dioxygenase-like cupin family protein
MRNHRLEDMVKGWFVGNFSPAVLSSESCEVAIKRYAAGDYEPAHFHKISTEITAIVSGQAEMFGQRWSEGDIITIEPGEVTDFSALTDVVTVVVKMPSSVDDKFLA